MPSSSAAVRHLALAMLVIGTAPALAQGANDPGTIIVYPARVPVAGSPASHDRANLPSAPPGPVESRLLPIPESTNLRLPNDVGHGQSPPLAAISFDGQSAKLTEATRAELQRIAQLIEGKRLRHIELRAFADGGHLDGRKVALARALVVRSYLLDLKVKSRIEVGSFAGDGQHVDILVPNT